MILQNKEHPHNESYLTLLPFQIPQLIPTCRPLSSPSSKRRSCPCIERKVLWDSRQSSKTEAAQASLRGSCHEHKMTYLWQTSVDERYCIMLLILHVILHKCTIQTSKMLLFLLIYSIPHTLWMLPSCRTPCQAPSRRPSRSPRPCIVACGKILGALCWGSRCFQEWWGRH